MKKFVIYFSVYVLFACNPEHSKVNNSNAVINYEQIEKLHNDLSVIKPFNKDEIKMHGLNLYKKSVALFADNKELNDDQLEFLFQCIAMGAEAAQMYKDAALYFLKAQRKFPKSTNAPIYLHNRARILDDKLKDKNNARLAYEELMEIYPDHPLSINTEIYLNNAFNKSQEDILKLIQ